MCRGKDEERTANGLNMVEVPKVVSGHATMCLVFCELCCSQASLYCQADDAFLCRKCDKQVHEANFLAFRHIRCLLCHSCQSLTERYLIGNSLELMLPTMNWMERKQCDPKVTMNCPRMLKKWPSLFL
ncbi:hypothetical protein NE237_031925 [Protea cynaroides]|uniref:B box-type domain-containing protein n=1 Tax=Protea cynaroides TaxID=273540 RepID=A0A9Q0R2M1_9MAGN|nr:hypothetical protein NE237_031925 [Protea cynaroides]